MVRNILFIAFIALGTASCSSLKPAATHKSPSTKADNNPRFIEDISVRPSSATSSKSASSGSKSGSSKNVRYASAGTATELLTSIQFKYGIMMDVAVEQLTNIKLLETIDEWYGARYRYGGTTKSGIDCSAFAGTLMTAVFGSALPRTAREQYAVTQRIKKEDLQEGDLVFFNTSGGVSHVGVYLNNNKFVHASTSAGVMISDLNEQYYSRKYVGAGRIL